MSSRLFTPLKLGKSQLAHRLALAPMTRYRVDDDYVQMPIVKGMPNLCLLVSPTPPAKF